MGYHDMKKNQIWYKLFFVKISFTFFFDEIKEYMYPQIIKNAKQNDISLACMPLCFIDLKKLQSIVKSPC